MCLRKFVLVCVFSLLCFSSKSWSKNFGTFECNGQPLASVNQNFNVPYSSKFFDISKMLKNKEIKLLSSGVIKFIGAGYYNNFTLNTY